MFRESNIWRCRLAPGTADDSLSDQSLLKQIAQCERPRDLIHMPAMADNDAFTRKCVRLEGGKKERNLGDVRHHGEFLIDGLAEHDFFDDALFRNAEFMRLLRDLLVDERSPHKARANDIRADAVLGALLGHRTRQTEKPMLRGNIGGLQRRRFVAAAEAETAAYRDQLKAILAEALLR